MTEREIEKIHAFLRRIQDKLLNVGVVLVDLEHDDITMTDEHKTKMISGMVKDLIDIRADSQVLLDELNGKLH